MKNINMRKVLFYSSNKEANVNLLNRLRVVYRDRQKEIN